MTIMQFSQNWPKKHLFCLPSYALYDIFGVVLSGPYFIHCFIVVPVFPNVWVMAFRARLIAKVNKRRRDNLMGKGFH